MKQIFKYISNNFYQNIQSSNYLPTEKIQYQTVLQKKLFIEKIKKFQKGNNLYKSRFLKVFES